MSLFIPGPWLSQASNNSCRLQRLETSALRPGRIEKPVLPVTIVTGSLGFPFRSSTGLQHIHSICSLFIVVLSKVNLRAH